MECAEIAIVARARLLAKRKTLLQILLAVRRQNMTVEEVRLIRFFRAIREIVSSTWTAIRAVNSRKYTPYPIGTPHKRADIHAATLMALRASAIGAEKTDVDAEVSRRAYLFIDRGVARAQGLLQFNSIVLACVVFVPSLLDKGDRVIHIVLILSLLTLIVSTLLCLACIWIIWLHPKDHIDKAQEAYIVWEIWIYRSLLFNVSLILATASFVGVSATLLYALIPSVG
jgi:hypothetical protein